MTPILEVAIVAVAAIISAISLKTLGAIRHLGVGKSFWIPVALSGMLFVVGSLISVLNLANFSMIATIPMIDDIAQTIRLAAMGVLLIGVVSYSRQVTKNLSMMPESMKLTAEKTFTRTAEPEVERETEYEEEAPSYRAPAYQTEPQTQEMEAPMEEQRLGPTEERPIQERLDQREYQPQIPEAGCRHEFGYLRTLPRNESIPDECLRCTKILDCRHGLATNVKTQTQTQPVSSAEE